MDDQIKVSHKLTLSTVNAPPGTPMAVATSMKTVDSMDFNGGFRFDETMAGGDNRALHVLTIDGAAVITDSMTDSVTMTIGGQTVTVQFNHSSIGAKVTIGNQSTTLTAGVDTLPE
jgi:hypothetical protein